MHSWFTRTMPVIALGTHGIESCVEHSASKKFMFQSPRFELREAPAGDRVGSGNLDSGLVSEEVSYTLKVYKACLVFSYKYQNIINKPQDNWTESGALP
jgi:hypothetical protein